MRKTVILATVAAFLATAALADELEQRAALSRAAVKAFAGELKGELVAALNDGGPASAIEVCGQSASAIAADISERTGWRVARTSLRLRNPDNAPDAWERGVLQDFERRRQSGEGAAKLEHMEIVDRGAGKTFRYMKAIPTATKPCLACHGDRLAPEVVEALTARYPKDQARGYGAGDIRGAFTITQPLE